jgi:hypothetical protein
MKGKKLKEPLDMDELLTTYYVGTAIIQAYYYLPFERQLIPNMPELLESRLNKLIERIENSHQSSLAQIVLRDSNGKVLEVDKILTITIAYDNYYEISEELAAAIIKNSFDYFKSRSFLFYFQREVGDETYVRMAKRRISKMAEKFNQEFEMLSKWLEPLLPDEEDREFWLEMAYELNTLPEKTAEDIKKYINKMIENGAINRYLERKKEEEQEEQEEGEE